MAEMNQERDIEGRQESNLPAAVGRGILLGTVSGVGLELILLLAIQVFRFQIDCGPHEMDGQCGMSLFFIRVFSFLISLGFSVVMGVFFAQRHLSKIDRL